MECFGPGTVSSILYRPEEDRIQFHIPVPGLQVQIFSCGAQKTSWRLPASFSHFQAVLQALK